MKNGIVASAKWLKERWLTDRSFAIWTASIITVLIRLAVSFAFQTYEMDPMRDHWAFGFEWGRIAKWLVQTGMFSLDGKVPTADTDPLYIFLIVPFFYAFGTFSTTAAIALIVFQSILCGLTTWAVFVLAEKLYSPFEARVSALSFAFYPASVFFAIGRIGPSSLAVLLLCLIFLAARRIPNSRGWRLATWTGLLTGIIVLTSSDNLSLLLVIPLWLFLVGAGQRGRMILQSSNIVAVAIVVIVPWAFRNSLSSGEPTISKANLGYHLYVGNHSHATGFFSSSETPEIRAAAPLHKQSEYYAMAFSWITQHPAEFLKLTLKRIQYFWYVIEGRYSRGQVLAAWLLLIMMSFAMIGLFWRTQGSQGVGLLWLFVAIYPLVFYFTHASFYRHRYHIEPFILILASHGLAFLWAYFRFGRVKTIEGAPQSKIVEVRTILDR